ncbi:hypothetical protein [Clostridium merdae]|uniref:hypothetical protein n=1 Tax=Clostridium merdae TaxID=1958780 RepID=UPI000A266D93|nr:hypothetical protein [Clostridium merdae]
MLGRLLKYEIKSTARIYLPLYLLLFLMAVINRVFISINSETLETPLVISMMAYVSIIVAISVITLVVTIQRFYKNLLTDEGYLMFTLPVSVDANILSKLLVATLWNITSAVVSVFSVLVLALDQESIGEFAEMWREILEFISQMNSSVSVIIFQSIVLILLSILVAVLNMYVAMAIGHLVQKHRVAGSLGAFFLIGLAEQIIMTLFIEISSKSGWFKFLNGMSPAGQIQWVLWAMIVGVLILGAIFYYGTRYILKNKLNLE